MNKVYINAATSLQKLGGIQQWKSNKNMEDPHTLDFIVNTMGDQDSLKIIEKLEMRKFLLSKVHPDARVVKNWLDNIENTLSMNAEIEAELERVDYENIKKNTMSVGVFFKVEADRSASSWTTNTDVQNFKHDSSRLKIVTKDRVYVKDQRVYASYTVNVNNTYFRVQLSVSDPNVDPEMTWDGVYTPREISIDLDSSAFEPFMKGACTDAYTICIAICKGKITIDNLCPLNAKIKSFVMVKSRGLKRPAPNPWTYYDMRNKTIKVELFCEKLPLVSAYYTV